MLTAAKSQALVDSTVNNRQLLYISSWNVAEDELLAGEEHCRKYANVARHQITGCKFSKTSRE